MPPLSNINAEEQVVEEKAVIGKVILLQNKQKFKQGLLRIRALHFDPPFLNERKISSSISIKKKQLCFSDKK